MKAMGCGPIAQKSADVRMVVGLPSTVNQERAEDGLGMMSHTDDLAEGCSKTLRLSNIGQLKVSWSKTLKKPKVANLLAMKDFPKGPKNGSRWGNVS